MRNVRFEGKTARRVMQIGIIVFELFFATLLLQGADSIATAAGVVGIVYTIFDVRRMGWPSFGAVDALFVIFYAFAGIPA